jgi:multiple sugar transport system permease protein
MMAASVVSLIPAAVIFMAGQKYFIQGVISSGIKG